MTYEDVKRIRENPAIEDVDNAWLAELIDKAIEKQIPKKATAYTNYAEHLKIGNCYWGRGTTVYRCPNCNEFVSRGFNCCCDCGQRLDWGDNK